MTALTQVNKGNNLSDPVESITKTPSNDIGLLRTRRTKHSLENTPSDLTGEEASETSGISKTILGKDPTGVFRVPVSGATQGNSSISGILEIAKNHLYGNSILQIVDFEKVNNSVEETKNLNLLQKVLHSCKASAKVLPEKLLIGALIINLFGLTWGETDYNPSLTEAVLIAPLLEEIIFRGVLQNGIYGFQRLIQKVGDYIPSLNGNRVCKGLISPSARILGASIPFSLIHLLNGGGASVVQAGLLILYPTFSIEYEKTGSILSPFAAHFTNNFLVALIGAVERYWNS